MADRWVLSIRDSEGRTRTRHFPSRARRDEELLASYVLRRRDLSARLADPDGYEVTWVSRVSGGERGTSQ